MNNVKNELMNTPSQKEVILPKDNEDNRISLTEDTLSNTTKMTFKNTPYPQTSVKDRIQQYQGNTENLRGNCVKRSGRCSTHKCVLLREVVGKKISTMDKCGKIVWTMGEVTILRYPLPVSTDGQISAIQQGLVNTANKRRKKYFDSIGQLITFGKHFLLKYF